MSSFEQAFNYEYIEIDDSYIMCQILHKNMISFTRGQPLKSFRFCDARNAQDSPLGHWTP